MDRTPRFGGHGGGDTPGPIPNPEVKPSSADGTARATGWESRSLPEHLQKSRPLGGGSSHVSVSTAAAWRRVDDGYAGPMPKSLRPRPGSSRRGSAATAPPL